MPIADDLVQACKSPKIRSVFGVSSGSLLVGLIGWLAAESYHAFDHERDARIALQERMARLEARQEKTGSYLEWRDGETERLSKAIKD